MSIPEGDIPSLPLSLRLTHLVGLGGNVASSNKRERDLARAKRERQLKRRRNSSTSMLFGVIGGLAVLAVIFVVFFTGDSETSSGICEPAPTANSNPSQWETAPASSITTGTYNWTLSTNCGDIVIEVDASRAPETANSMQFLTDNNFFDNSPCHRIVTSVIYVLQCGDPTGTVMGSAGYRIAEENLPSANPATYTKGQVAMANSGQPGTSGSQFFIVFQDSQLSPTYTVFGKVVQGLDIVEKIAAAGVATGATDGAPAE
ncbi:MAG: peptidylprolyl isomerase, partial [Candidatus Nanopelagicales bacterium]